MRKFLCIIIILVSYFSLEAQVMFTADLNGDQETPSVSTKAKGTGWFLFNPDSSSLTYRVTYAQLDSTFVASHFHMGKAGSPGSVVFPVQFKGNTASGTWKVPDSLVGNLLNEDIYFNVHSAAHPGGEIRGQLRRISGIGFSVSLTSAQANPPNNSTSEGTAYAVLTNKGSEVKYAATFAGLSSNFVASHFHNADTSTAGPVVEPISFTDSSASGSWTGFSDTMLTELLHNRIYLNVHSVNFTGGEIRGQLIKQGDVMFKISMNGEQETPSVMTSAKATGWVVFNSNLSGFKYSITYADLSSAFAASHFHHGAMGVQGNVIIPISFTGNQANGSVDSLADSLVNFMIKEEVYANVHSTNHAGGEIRGQLELVSGIGFTAVLSGDQEVPPNNSTGVGTGWLDYGMSGSEDDSAKYEFTIANLSSALTGSHFHNAPRFVSGPVVHPITFMDSTASGVWFINDSSLTKELIKENIYVNAHSNNFQNGEIRGQLLFAGVQSGTVNSVSEEMIGAPAGYSLEQNYPNPFNPATKIRYSVPNDGFVKIKIYNAIGQEVAVLVNQLVKAGSYELNWNAGNVPSGIYFYRLETDNFSSVRKMILMK